MAMMAMTTNSSIRVKAPFGLKILRIARLLHNNGWWLARAREFAIFQATYHCPGLLLQRAGAARCTPMPGYGIAIM
jgi:hypothetical protein